MTLQSLPSQSMLERLEMQMAVEKEDVAAEGLEARARFGNLLNFLIHRYPEHFGLRHLDDPGSVARQIKAQLLPRKADPRMIEPQVGGSKKQKPNAPYRQMLTDYCVNRLKGRVPGFDAGWLDLASVDDLKKRIEEAAQDALALQNENARKEMVFGLKVPRQSPRVVRAVHDQLCHHYVCYRFALESVDRTGAPREVLAREIVSFRPKGEMIEFVMSYRLSHDKDADAVRAFRGQAIVLGQSLMCVATDADTEDSDRDLNLDRGRVIFMHRDRIPGSDARFGIMATTRAEGRFEPCATCVLMFRVDGLQEEEREAFAQEVTAIDTVDAVLASDFASLTEKQRYDLIVFLDNQPRGASEGRVPDKILKIWYDRFEQLMPEILQRLYGDDSSAPFAANGRKR